MNFDCSELQQLSSAYIQKLSPERVVALFELLRQDLMCAHDRLNQNPSNSSRPPSTRAPWEKPSENESIIDNQDKISQKEKPSHQDANDPENGPCEDSNDEKRPKSAGENEPQKRKPGRQPNSQGFGRTQKLIVTHEIIHRPECCKGCAKTFESCAKFQATCGYYSIDISPPEPGTIGVFGTYTKHIFGFIPCNCGFETATAPHRAEKELGWSVEMGEWRLIGPMLLAFIVFAKLRLHLTVSKTQELLKCWFGISLSKGSINTALLEAGRATSYLKPELIAALRASGLLHVDETSWKEHKISRWLWVAVGNQVVYFSVGARSLEMAQSIIGDFAGNLMTDGYTTYRSFANRLRCWAHLKRKSKALAESWDKSASAFGSDIVKAFEAMQDGVYQMREMKLEERAGVVEACDKIRLGIMMACLSHQDAKHEKVQAFAGEILRDHQVIFRVLKEPDLPLTNNAAEQALRPLVILRKICYGSKTDEGSRTIAMLASVAETVRLRGRHTWSFLSSLFRERRAGRPPPPLPAPIMLSS